MAQSSAKQASAKQQQHPSTAHASAKQGPTKQAPNKQEPVKQESAAESGPPSAAITPATPPIPARATRPWVPRAAGWLCYLVGMFDILSALFPRVRHLESVNKYGHLVPGLQVNPYAIAASLIVGMLLVSLAHALRRRKHRAWMGVVALLGASIAVHMFRKEPSGGIVLYLVFLILLIVYREEFYALSDPRSRWRAIWTFWAMLVADVGLGLILVSARGDRIIGGASLFDRVDHVVLGLAGITGPMHFRGDNYGDYVYFSLFGLGLLTVLVTLYLFLRPAEPAARLTPAQETEIRALLTRHGRRDSLGYFALRRDKSVLFSPTGKAAIAYRVVSGVMLASGDPIGDPEAWPGAIRAFMDRAERYAWIPAVMGCSEQAGEIWHREAGMDALELGDEAVVEVADFSLEGRPMRNVRQMVHRIERQGYSCQVRRLRDISPDEVVRIRRLATDGRSTETERGFSMALGRFGDPADGECVVVTATKDDEIRAVLDFVPWGQDGLSLDLMRRDRSADPGLNELMIVAALREAPALGVARISLNFAVFRSALERGERLGAGPVLRRWRGLLVFLSRWFQIESLYRFNAKFRPVWEPRFVAFRQTRDLPRIALAALEAEAFLVLPSLLRRGPRDEPDVASLRTY
ncbi:MAG TPA: phosphatidylglycerol lysyltransferase domain-containing protein [Actinocrinis sp.]|uniref:phosphatidylglycerol lysyltransferase domain-containing protein n=1 Tax=Actinocrinis sp. TaxID=1920516 RepID=UPI002DDCF35A|nr:phosphatidylglycerol lysyltransferase domain-containing protein [Actinocrinis sp.]HEV2348084.1 phosphatidylglycerol lysyltransferase domain-containing protein [Actinocrinis sp.]